MPDDTIDFFNLTKRQCVLKSGEILPITSFLTDENEVVHEYDDDAEGWWFIAGHDDTWFSVYIDDWVPVTRH